MRSLLVVSGNIGAAGLRVALDADADALALDLSASVRLDRKAAARDAVRLFLEDAGQRRPRPLLLVQVNALASGLTDADLDTVMSGAPDGIVLPQTVSGQNVQHLAAKLAVREAENGLPDAATRIVAVAGDAAAIFHMGSYAGASRRLLALAWSAADLTASLGGAAARAADGAFSAPCSHARSLTLFAAKAAGVLALDTGFPAASGDHLRRECEAARREGYTGKLATEPAQVAVINAAFGG